MRRFALLLLAALLVLPGGITACSSHHYADGSTHRDVAPQDSAETAMHWRKARKYQNDMRYELARQEYLLALTTCRSEATRNQLQRELQTVDLQIRTLR